MFYAQNFYQKLHISRDIVDWTLFLTAVLMGYFFKVEPVLLGLSILAPWIVLLTLIVLTLLTLSIDWMFASFVSFLKGLALILGLVYGMSFGGAYPFLKDGFSYISDLFTLPKQVGDAVCFTLFLTGFAVGIFKQCWHLGYKHLFYETFGDKSGDTASAFRFLKEERASELTQLQAYKFTMVLHLLGVLSFFGLAKMMLGYNILPTIKEVMHLVFVGAFWVLILPVNLRVK